MRMYHPLLLLRSFGLLAVLSLSLGLRGLAQTKPAFLAEDHNPWVEQTLQSMTLDEKIGQLLMPRGNTSGKGYDPEKLMRWVKEYKVGGLVFFAGQPSVQARIINELQAASKVPMLIGMDLEWGLAMRLDSTVRFPYALSLGAIQGQEALLEAMGAEVGRQCRRLGVHINYAPVVDVNINPNNPVINFRSFGSDPAQVTRKALAYMRGMQRERILTTAKHFPGHGDTGVDSHYDLPLVTHNRARLDSIELAPYRALIAEGLSGVMTAHLSIPSLDATPNLASTLSSKIVMDLLRKDLGFEGLVFTDAMDMQGAVKYFPNGEALVRAILAGNDVLETFEEVPVAVEAIKKALREKKISLQDLDTRVRRILMAKVWVGLDRYTPTRLNGLVEDLHSTQAELLNRQLAEASLVLVKNEGDLLPVKDLTQRIAVVSVDAAAATPFQQMSSNYTTLDHFQLPVQAPDSLIARVLAATAQHDLVVVSMHLQNIRPYSNYGITEANQKALKRLSARGNVVVVLLGNAYALGKLDGLAEAKAVLVANQLTPYMEEAAAQALFGAIPIEGRLPVSVNSTYPAGLGLSTRSIGRLAYGIPEMVGLDGRQLAARVDSVLLHGLEQKAYPGAVMQIAKNGRVIYQKAVGYHTYEQAERAENLLETERRYAAENKNDVMDGGKVIAASGAQKAPARTSAERPEGKVQLTDLYDMASVTKISTSALAVMQLMSEGKFDLDKTLGDYVEEFRGSNKAHFTFRDMLTHRSGLKAWIPFWMDCIDSVATVKNSPAFRQKYATPFKLTFWERLLGRTHKQDRKIAAALRTDKQLWADCLTPATLVWKPGIFSKRPDPDYPVQVTDSLWLHHSYRNTLFEAIKDSPINPEQGYVYSDLHFYTYPTFVPRITGMDWESYLKKTYQAIGATTLTYNPRRYFPLSRIVPTEYDPYYRQTQIHGRVHDEGASMLDGVSGHAGLFGSANDLMKLMQLYLQRGYFGGQQWIKPEVVEECTKYQFPDRGLRRAIAFDKLDFNKKIQNGPQLASSLSYGHSGYTGTFTWVDPAYDLVYVFLSNRVYPTRDNVKISTLNIRTEVGNQIYRTLLGR